MAQKDVREIVATLGLMAEAERCISRFYLLCADKLPDDREFWENISAEEVGHAASIAKMAEIVTEKVGEGFEFNRAFNRTSVNTFTLGVDASAEALKKGALAGRRIYFVSRDIEQALLEARYGEVVRTSDSGFTALLQKIMEETRRHYASLQEKIDSLD